MSNAEDVRVRRHDRRLAESSVSWNIFMSQISRNTVCLLLLGSLLYGCASTKLTNNWQDPHYSGPPLTKVLLIGVTKQAVVRRYFEDAFARQLADLGTTAVPSYTLIPEDGEVPKDRMAQAVQQSGADGVLITRLVRVDRRARIEPGYAGPPFMGFYDYYPFAWGGFYDPPMVYTYDVVTWDTSVFDARTNQMIWAGATETVAPKDLAKEAREAAAVVVKALVKGGILPQRGR
jgi:hypothetical protein